MSDKISTYHFCGIGGSGMLPLALILLGQGHIVTGSDRSRDQMKNPEKFSYLESKGIKLYPQDGSGIKDTTKTLIVSAAVEDTIPDVRVAKEKGVPVKTRAEILSGLFNQSKVKIAVAGTSGKTTTTGMIGYILQECGYGPTVMNGGIFKNYRREDPYCSALVGNNGLFVTECDESDGTIELYHPDIAVLNNIALDHKSLDELNDLFSHYLAKARVCVLNADHPAVMAMKSTSMNTLTYGMNVSADVSVSAIQLFQDGSQCLVHAGGVSQPLTLNLPGRHNISNALAAIAACLSHGLGLKEICTALSGFKGIWRRLDTLGTKSGITVIDDFAHNPDKISASLHTLKQFPGRLIVFFQPHGYGFLKLVWKELAKTFSDILDKDDVLLMVQPFYAGGTVDRSIDSTFVIRAIEEQGKVAHLLEGRQEIKSYILQNAHKGDRIVIMGARDDTLAEFAEDILLALSDL